MTDGFRWLLSRGAAIAGSVLWGAGIGYAVFSCDAVYSAVMNMGHVELGIAVTEVVIGAFLVHVLFDWAAVPALARYKLLLIGAAAALFAGLEASET